MSKSNLHTTDNDEHLIFYDDDTLYDDDDTSFDGLDVLFDQDFLSTPDVPDEQATISIEASRDVKTNSKEEQHLSSPPTIQARPSSSKINKWMWAVICILSTTTLCAALYVSWQLYNYYYNIGVPISTEPEENIVKLSKPYTKGTTPNIVISSDSILGVALNMYELKNLQAEIRLTEPDTADTSVWMYSRCADHTSNNQYLGSLVINGKELSSDVSRLGYCGMANGNIVIGISRSDKVKNYVVEHKGNYFRQFMLLSNGVIPTHFPLHGKVERRALARMNNDQLYYVATRHPETLWDFSDALREYGFADAIYITGGNSHSYYRTADGKPHSIGNDTIQASDKDKNIVPWIVFKAR